MTDASEAPSQSAPSAALSPAPSAPAPAASKALAANAEPEKRHWFDQMDEIEWDSWDGDIERLPCSVGYVISCLLLPFFNGCINGFAASSVGLYFKDMAWPLWRLGLALSLGFSMRLITQRIQVRLGIWTALPMATFHLTGAILAVLFTAEEWAIFAEIVCLCAFDSSMAIEGIAYDTFKDYPEDTDMARQATSTSLGVFTVSIASACTAGGFIYDAYQWQGLSIFHCSCQGSLLLLLLISPTCRQSFMACLYGDPDEEDSDAEIAMKDLQVQPNQPGSPLKASAEEIKTEAAALAQKLPGQSDLVVEDVEDPSRISKVSFSAKEPESADAADAPEEEDEGEEGTDKAKKGKVSTVSGASEKSKMSKGSSRVTFGAEEVQSMVEDLPGAVEKDAKLAAEGDPTWATAAEDEVIVGVDYDQVDDLKDIFHQQSEDALTPTSRMNRWSRRGHKKSLILTHRIEGTVQNYEETVGSRQLRISDDADEHLVPCEPTSGGHPRGSKYSGRGSMHSARASRVSRASRASRASRMSQVSRGSRASRKSAASRHSHISRTSEATLRVSRTTDKHARRRASEWSENSEDSRLTRGTMKTTQSTGTMRSNMTLRSQMTSLAEAGTNFEHHFMVNSTLGPQIVTKTGQDDVEDDFGEEEAPLEDVPWVAKGTIPPGSRIPLFLIGLCGLVNSFCYATEFSTFAVLYREYYNINDAATGALCQTAGDVVAAISMQINTFSDQFGFCDGCLGLWYRLAFPPYNLSWALFVWILLSLSMISGVFPLAVTGQVLMSCTYCLTSKFSSELIFFYTRGDVKAFMKLQVYVRSSEALAAALANFVGLFLMEAVNPWVPYLVCSCMSFVVCVLYTNIFCGRLSCRDIVVAEEKRLNAGI